MKCESSDFYEQALHNYNEQLITCEACGSGVKMKDWPLVPSTGKPKLTCCRTTGWNVREAKEKRKRVIDGITHWVCKSCNEIKAEKAFANGKRGLAASCNKCKAKKARDTMYPSRIKAKAQTQIRRIKKELEIIECKSCGKKLKRKDWPKDKSGKLATRCCVERGLAHTNRYLRRRGKKFCNACSMVKLLSHFPVVNGKDASPCRPCKKASLIKQNADQVRLNRIVETDDDTLSSSAIGRLFSSADFCPVCSNKMSFTDKTLDHIRPLSLGGTHSIKNAMIICHGCNTKKGAKLPSAWLSSLSEESRASVLRLVEESIHLSSEIFIE